MTLEPGCKMSGNRMEKYTLRKVEIAISNLIIITTILINELLRRLMTPTARTCHGRCSGGRRSSSVTGWAIDI